MRITAIVENDTIKLPEGVHVPDGTKVEICLPENAGDPPEPANVLAWMMKYAGCINGPVDFAAEHDHYIHGTEKRGPR
jgi:hypothetical protein